MPTLLDKQLAEEKPIIKSEHDSFRTTQHLRWLLPISFLLLTILIIIASIQNPTKTDEDHLEELQAMVRHACSEVAAHQPDSSA
jgi:hypothetical protein